MVVKTLFPRITVFELKKKLPWRCLRTMNKDISSNMDKIDSHFHEKSLLL